MTPFTLANATHHVHSTALSMSHHHEGSPHNALRSPSRRKEYGAQHLTRIAGVLISFSGANVLTITCEQGLKE